MTKLVKWVKEHIGIVHFNDLVHEDDKYMFVLYSSYLYFRSLHVSRLDAYQRAIDITKSHSIRNYKEYTDSIIRITE
jgi:hypothetical protein